jgi:hypothetical protein
MNKRIKKKHTMRNGQIYLSMYRDKKPLMPFDWFIMLEEIRAGLDHPLSQKTINMLKRRYRHLYYRTYEQRHLLWDLGCTRKYVESKRLKRSRYKLMKRIINDIKRAAEQVEFTLRPVQHKVDQLSNAIFEESCKNVRRSMLQPGTGYFRQIKGRSNNE